MNSVKDKDIAIDILKFIAAIIITNSHMDILYGKYSFMATGGAIGDTLFFFCSGYTLLLGRGGNFFNWYKRRINRIYPTVFSWMLVCCIVWNYQFTLLDVILHGGGWFIECIMIYYAILWIIKRYAIQHLNMVFLVSAIIIFIRYVFFINNSECEGIYGATTFKYWIFFLSMLSGAILGVKKRGAFSVGNIYVNAFLLFVSISLFYILCFFGKSNIVLSYLQFFTIFALISSAYYLYKFCCTDIVKKLYNHSIYGFAIKSIGGLCLEIYLVQYALLTDNFNNIFPLNLPIMFLVIILAAYILKILSNVWKQTFMDCDYDIRKIIKIY